MEGGPRLDTRGFNDLSCSSGQAPQNPSPTRALLHVVDASRRAAPSLIYEPHEESQVFRVVEISCRSPRIEATRDLDSCVES